MVDLQPSWRVAKMKVVTESRDTTYQHCPSLQPFLKLEAVVKTIHQVQGIQLHLRLVDTFRALRQKIFFSEVRKDN